MSIQETAKLNVSLQELMKNRRYQGALHAYLFSCIEDMRNGKDRSTALKPVVVIDPNFPSTVVTENISRSSQHYFCVKTYDGASWHYEFVGLKENDNHVYYFYHGWPINYEGLLREEDLVPSGVCHLNGDRASWERALAKLSQDPESGIRTMEDLHIAEYNRRLGIFLAIGIHEAPLTKPLLRIGIAKGSPEEELNMHSGTWQPTGGVQDGFERRV